MNNFKAVIFDIDGTLTPEISWTAFTRDIGGSVAEHLAIYEDHLNGDIGYDQSKGKLLELWQSTGSANKRHIEALFDKWPIRPEAKPLINYLKDKGYKLCLITGSVGMYAKHMAEKLGVDEYYANAELHFDAEGNLIDFDYTTDQAEVKIKQLKEYCNKNALDLSDCVPIGDSNNDIELFKQTGNGILVSDTTVADELKSSAWRTIRNLNEVKNLI